MITVHGRTRQQFYKGQARWHLVHEVVDAVDVPVVVNGDIVDAAGAREALAQSGAAAVMVGRGAQGQPWVVGQIAAELAGRTPADAPHGDELTDLIIEHYEGILSEYGTAVGVRAARKHLDWYLEAAGLHCSPSLRKSMLESLSASEVVEYIRHAFSEPAKAAA